MSQENRLILSFNRALYGVAHCEILQYSAHLEPDRLFLRAVVTGPLSDEITDDISSISAEVAADFPDLEFYDELVSLGDSNLMPEPLSIQLFARPHR